MGSKKELLFYSPVGVMCVSTSRHGHLAIYSQDSPKCRNPSKITVRKTKAGNFAIYNGTAPACMDYIKGRGTYYPGLAIGKKCAHVDPITFDTRIPVPLAPGSLHTAQSYDELAVQMHYFVPLVSIHLAALKEIYLYGSMKGFAKEQFNTKKQQYLNWISSYLPIFEQYVGIAGFNATRQIETLYAFQKHLDSASLDPTVVHFNIDNE